MPLLINRPVNNRHKQRKGFVLLSRAPLSLATNSPAPIVNQRTRGRRSANVLVTRSTTAGLLPVQPPTLLAPQPTIKTGRGSSRRSSRLVLTRNPLYSEFVAQTLPPPPPPVATTNPTIIHMTRTPRAPYQWPEVSRTLGYIPNQLFIVGVADTDTISASISRGVALHKTPADTPLINDSVKQNVLRHFNESETIPINDAITLHNARVVIPHDSIPIADSAGSQHHLTPPAILDSALISDLSTLRPGYHKSLNDIVLVSDAVTSVQATLHVSLSETVAISDALFKALHAHVSLTDLVEISDFAAAAVTLTGHPQHISASVFEADEINAAAFVKIVRTVTNTDHIDISDFVFSKISNFSILDSISLSDHVTVVLTQKRHKIGRPARMSASFRIRRGSGS